MASFTRLEVWTDVACNAGVRVGTFEQGVLAACEATFALDGQESLAFTIVRGTPYADAIVRGRVVRVCTTDAATFDEWRITDVEDESGSILINVQCFPIALDLARALYVAYDGTGAPFSEFGGVQIDLHGVIDGPVREALDEAGLTWIVKGTIEPTATTDLAVDWPSARSLLLAAVESIGGEIQVRRNGTTDYRIDILTSIGASAASVYARTSRNLLSTERTRSGELGGTRIVPRGQDDSTHRGCGYAAWEIVSIPSATELVLRDPRGAGYPSPLPFAGMAANWYVTQIQATYNSDKVITSADGPSAGESTIEIADTSYYTAGQLVEFRLTAGTSALTYVNAYATATDSISNVDVLRNDVVLWWSYNGTDNTVPGTPSGFTVLGSTTQANSAATLSVLRATADSSLSLTTTDTNNSACIVIRGSNGVGDFSILSDALATATYDGLTLESREVPSLVVGFGGFRSAINGDDPPTGMVNEAYALGTPDYHGIAVHMTPTPVTAWTAQTVPLTQGSLLDDNQWATATVEVTADVANANRVWGLTDPAAVTLYGGIFDRVLDRPLVTGATNLAPNPFVADFSGTFKTNSGPTGTLTCSTGSAVVTSNGATVAAGRFTIQASVGDRLRRYSDNALIGTINTVDAVGQVTLTANALISASAVRFFVEKNAPVGVDATNPSGGWFVLTEQVASNIENTASQAIRLRVFDSSVTGGAFYLPPVRWYQSDLVTLNYWVWIEAELITAGSTFVVELVRDDTKATIGSNTVTLLPSQQGNFVRVMFTSVDTSLVGGADVRVLIRYVSGAALGNEGLRVIIGPWGAAPSGWATKDVGYNSGCDLWHEGTLWLSEQTLPTSYQLSIADLSQINGYALNSESLTLGGNVVIDDRQLGVVTTQRLVAFTRDYVTPGSVSLTLGRRNRTLAEYLADQSRVNVPQIALSLSKGIRAGATRQVVKTTQLQTPLQTVTEDFTVPLNVSTTLLDSFSN